VLLEGHVMRELTKTALRFSWSFSLFGVQQLANVFTPSRAARAFDSAARTMEQELSDALRAAFRAGDSLQSGLVDLTLGPFTGGRTDQGSGAPPARTDAAQPHAARPPAGQRATGWGPIPYPVNPPGAPAGAASPPPTGPAPAAEANISAAYPFEPHYVDVLGSRMHYVEVGSGEPILLLHGNPTWSYLWRNIIPHLAPLGRCVAPDLVGFGRSAKPDIEYRWYDHVDYVDAFIDKMRLRGVTLVLHDQGSGLGFHYASRHQDNVKALAFFEALIRPFPWDQYSTPEFRDLFRRFRTGGRGGEGWKLIVDQNAFIEQLLPQACGRPLTPTEMEYYREPFRDPASRLPVWQFPRQTPIGGEPADVWAAATAYSRWLQTAPQPKLLLYATPGALITAEHLDWARQNIANLETVFLGPGAHFLQESSPYRIGTEIANWLRRLRGEGSGAAGRAGRAARRGPT
jgi:haloalkane dehalogenase